MFRSLIFLPRVLLSHRNTLFLHRARINSRRDRQLHVANPVRAKISENDTVVDVLQKIQDTPEVAEAVVRFSETVRSHGFDMQSIPSKMVLFQMLSKPAIKDAAFQMVAVFEKNGIQFNQEIAMKLASSLPAFKGVPGEGTGSDGSNEGKAQ